MWLKNVTLLGVDCINIERLQKAVDISARNIEFGEIKLLTSLETADSRKVPIPHISSIEQYSNFCIHELFKYVNTEFVLLIQYDGFVINPKSWTDEFLKFDYIGAPWRRKDIIQHIRAYGLSKDDFGHKVVGNGGFSLRSKKLLELSAEFAREGKIAKLHPEDLSICIWNRQFYEARGIRFAPSRLASRFCIEKGTYRNQFGFHNDKITNISKRKRAKFGWEV